MLRNIFAAFAQYKILTLILVIAVVATVFVWIKAIRASRRRNAQREELLAKLRQEEELRQTYAAVTPALAETAPMPDMLHGIALCIQQELEKTDDMEASFSALPTAKQHLYALDFVFCEDADTISGFFRLNGKLLKTAARDGARAAFPPEALAVFERGYAMFDDEDETTSCLPADVQSLDEAFAALDRAAVWEGIRTYITAAYAAT